MDTASRSSSFKGMSYEAKPLESPSPLPQIPPPRQVNGDNDDRPSKIFTLLKIAQYITTTPWHNLYIATQQMIDIDDEKERNISIKQWAKDKRTEYKYVSLAGTIVASAVTGSIQWNQTSQGHWVVLASWYGGLLLSLFCIIVAFHLSILIATFDARSDGAQKLYMMIKDKKWSAKGDRKARNSARRDKPSDICLFILQVPIMLLSYSIISYIAGLITLVVGPLWRGVFTGDGANIAYAFLVYLFIGLTTYIVVCFMVYKRFLPDMLLEVPDGSMLRGLTLRPEDEP